MAKGPTSVAAPTLKRTPFVRGTWPPQPEPIAETVRKGSTIKPAASSTREYGKQPPLGGNTGMTGYS